MSKEIYISSTPHETRLAIVENDDLTEIYYERENEYTLAGSIYNGKVTRVLPGMQSSFVDIGLERDAFLYITDFLEEAGDAADFEGAEGGRRSEGGRGEGRGRSRGDALVESDRPVIEGGEARFTEPGSGDRSREGGGERGRDRGGRRRGSRDGRGGRQSEAASVPRVEAALPATSMPVFQESAEEEPEGTESLATDVSEAGEGSPAAEGSRRWRGRRGRRRGRNGREGQPEAGTETGAQSETGSGTDSDDLEAVAGADAASGYDLDQPVGEQSLQGDAARDRDEVDLGTDSEVEPEIADFLSASAATEAAVDVAEPGAAAAIMRADIEGRGGRPEREGRGDRGRGADRGGRGSREGSRDAGRSRGSRRDSSYGMEEEQAEEAAPAEPILLPGESLAKYRAADAGAAEAVSSQGLNAPAPLAEFRLAGSWDGGNVLPGETIRPRSVASADSERGESRGRAGELRGDRDSRGSREGRGGRDGRTREMSGSRDERGGRGGREGSGSRGGNREGSGGRGEVSGNREGRGGERGGRGTPAPGRGDRGRDERGGRSLQAPAGFAPRAYGLGASADPQRGDAETQGISPASYDSDAPRQPMAETSSATAAERNRPVKQEPAAESELTEGSASYRVDPASPREFRQPSETAGATEAPSAEESLAHSITPAAGEALAPIQFGPAGEGPGRPAEVEVVSEGFSGSGAVEVSSLQGSGSAADFREGALSGAGDAHGHATPVELEAAQGHDVTAIGSDGEMLSAVPPPPPVVEMADPTAPIEHETAIVDRHAVDSETNDTGYTAGMEGDGSAAFEESEEAENDEDFHTTTLHAAAIEEMDYDDDVVETSTDLGGLIRDMSIDQMTLSPDGSAETDDDEFAFEEEDTVGEYESGDASPAAGSGEPMFASGDAEMTRFSAAEAARESVSAEETRGREPRGGRREGRRGGRERGRSSGSDRGSSDRGGASLDRGGSSDRNGGSGFRAGRREGHRSAQTTNLPAISDLLKPGQELLVQIAKEPIAKKGARITSHIALPGRFLVFMPTVNHTGVSRKIESDGERRRLKEILLSEKGDASGGFIVRTAAAGASEEELRSDLRFLLNLWADIKQRSEGSKSPALIYHDLNLVERILRDQVTDNFSAIWVDNETDYERILRFLQRFQPSLIRRVKLYTKETPLFEQFGISEEINKALRSKVWLKSGGSIVINQTEALVAIDINTGKYVGKTARLEDTIVKTNLDAIPEIVRQIRLRDLGGIIIIDFIDMDERKNRARVMAALEDELKKDRAPSKVLQFNDFGLVAITRKRVKQSLERTLSTPCNTCTGTGMVKSPVTVCNDIYVEMRKMQKHLDRGDVMLRVNPEVVKQLKSPTARWLQEMEEMVGKTILVKSDPALHPEQFDIH